MSYPVDPELGWYYVVSVAGEVGGVQYDVGDWIVWNGTSWDRVVGKQLVLPIGAVIMYDGVGIANAGTRSVQIGDEGGDAFKMHGWFVCNGLAGTPDLEKMFVRGGLVSGVVEGSDDAVVVSHTHDMKKWTTGVTVGAEDRDYPNTGGVGTSDIIVSAGVDGVNKNIPIHYTMIYVIRMS